MLGWSLTLQRGMRTAACFSFTSVAVGGYSWALAISAARITVSDFLVKGKDNAAVKFGRGSMLDAVLAHVVVNVRSISGSTPESSSRLLPTYACPPIHLLSLMRAYHVRIVLHHISSSKSEQANTFTPLSLWQPLPAHAYKSTARRNATFNPRGKDYRFGSIALDWVDLDNMPPPLFVSQGRADPKGAFMAKFNRQNQKLSLYSGPAIATFVPQRHTKSGTTNLPSGVVHVFRDSERHKLAETCEGTSTPDDSRVMLENADCDGYMVGVLAVPSWMAPSDFLAFVAPAEDGMSHLRMIRCVPCAK